MLRLASLTCHGYAPSYSTTSQRKVVQQDTYIVLAAPHARVVVAGHGQSSHPARQSGSDGCRRELPVGTLKEAGLRSSVLRRLLPWRTQRYESKLTGALAAARTYLRVLNKCVRKAKYMVAERSCTHHLRGRASSPVCRLGEEKNRHA